MDPACAVHLTQKCCMSTSVPMHVCFDYEQFSKQVKKYIISPWGTIRANVALNKDLVGGCLYNKYTKSDGLQK